MIEPTSENVQPAKAATRELVVEGDPQFFEQLAKRMYQWRGLLTRTQSKRLRRVLVVLTFAVFMPYTLGVMFLGVPPSPTAFLQTRAGVLTTWLYVCVLVVGGVLFADWLVHDRRTRDRHRRMLGGECLECGYNLTYIEIRQPCPECGVKRYL